jgi:fermentation-respiration switch protein FrsA (DUF1100 family)
MQRNFLKTLLLAAALLAAGLLPFAEMNQSTAPPSIEDALFFPSKYPTGNWTPGDLDYEDVFFLSEDGTSLHGWYCPAENPRGAVLIAHGNAGHVASRASLLRHLQSTTHLSVFIFDYRGYGRSEGVPSVDGALQDAKAAREKLRQLAAVDNAKMILMGESLGGAIVVQLAAESNPQVLILQSTFSSLRELAEVHYPQNASLVPTTTLDSVSTISQFKGLLFQSHGENDKTIPIGLGEKLFRAANEPKEFVLISNSDHNDWMTDEYFENLDEFINQPLVGESSIPER